MKFTRFFKKLWVRIHPVFSCPVYFGRYPVKIPGHALILFPLHPNRLYCGLAGIISYQKQASQIPELNMSILSGHVTKILEKDYQTCTRHDFPFSTDYLGGDDVIDELVKAVADLKCIEIFFQIFTDASHQQDLLLLHEHLLDTITRDSASLSRNMGSLEPDVVRAMVTRLETLKDIAWCIHREILGNIIKIKELLSSDATAPPLSYVSVFKKINAVLNSIDRLEVRGRDSAGISLMFWMEQKEYETFEKEVSSSHQKDLFRIYQDRLKKDLLLNGSIRKNNVLSDEKKPLVAITLVYKFASEVGSLGENVQFLRQQIKSDAILHLLARFPLCHDSVCAHTRWASVGAINEPNCHPVDNRACSIKEEKFGEIHVCLNGDIDNYLELKEKYENTGRTVDKEITTDTKIIPLFIEQYLKEGLDVAEAFRQTVNLFEGSHAISMHTDMAPGKLFLAQKGSGQTIFVGLADDFYMSASEVYGFVEETPFFCKMNGEKIVEGITGKTQGQIFILDQNSPGGLGGIQAFYYDKTPIDLSEKDIQKTEITSRDIDRQGFDHYFLKEISEAPASVEKTLENRWKIQEGETGQFVVALDEKTIPRSIQTALAEHRIRRVFFVGQGTAGVAAKAGSDILNYYINDPALVVTALKASELSGFKISESGDEKAFADSLVIAISQSGTTTDTNRTVDMVKKQGAYTLAIVNRRDSDLTFKVDGVMYTSSGRDIEMSVASTKAFYSQIVAGALMGLHIAAIRGDRPPGFVTDEIKQLLALPEKMRTVLSKKEIISESARRTATAKNYWAVVGSGPNKASADEIRIKLSELCYKTISTDYVEDKKHIDLSSEPLIIVCAAGTRQTVIGDIIKDTAIFQAHKATPIIITDEGENRFDPYAADVFHVPAASEHLSPILNTLVGHIWGYYAALAINSGSAFFHGFREEIRQLIDEQSAKGLDVYEVILEKSFREKIAAFYYAFRKQKAQNRLPAIMGLESVSNLTLLLKYLSGRLPVSDFELDFGIKGTASNMLNKLFHCVGEAINCLSRPVDAIKHQAKTVTVGTSRISEKVEGLLFDAVLSSGQDISQLTNSNVMVLKNLQDIVAVINGAILYKIEGLDLLGEPTDETTITVVTKTGILKSIPSRVETDTALKGTKRIIVRQGNVYIGKGRKDNRSILVIPLISKDPARPNIIEHLLLLNISFKQEVPTNTKVKALGGKYEHIKSIVQENSIAWEDHYLDRVEIDELFGRSAEKIGESIVSMVS